MIETRKMLDIEQGTSGIGPRPSSPLPAVIPRRTRFSSVPLVELRHSDNEEDTHSPPSSVDLPRRHVTFADSDTHSLGGICSMSDTMESLKGGGGSPIAHPSVRIKHLTRTADGSSRFPKLDECAHFHYENVELGSVKITLCDEKPDTSKGTLTAANGADKENEVSPWWFCVQVSSNGRSWVVRRSFENFRMLDRQMHRCVYDRKFSLLQELPSGDRIGEDADDREETLRAMLTEYLERFSQLAGSLINCGPVLNWLELDNRGNRLIVTDEAAINTPAVAAAYVIKRYTSQARDEISFEVGDIISVIDMPPPEESSWWRGKKGFQVGFFPCERVEVIGDKVPQSLKIPKAPTKPVLRKHGKLIAFFRSFLLSRPSRRKLKQSGILKERVFGCDLGEHLMNTGRDIPLVLKCCSEFIEEHGIVDGIYRLSGVTSNIQKLRLAFDEDRVPDLLDEAIIQDIHCVASLLKMYFRELPNPLLTYHLYDKFVGAVQADEDVRLLRLRDVVQQLPPPHYRTLEYLMRHLTKVAAYGTQTGMTPKNVAIVWAPNLLRSRDVEGGGVGALHVVGVQAVLTEYLIRYTDIIFSEKMPMFHSPGPGDGTPKKTRPKSLAISTPTKLLSLEEARSRALSANLPAAQQKYIEVGGGPDNLPAKYHTVIDLPMEKRGSTKLKKSPSSWKSFFSRGWHTSSTRDKDREKTTPVAQSSRKISPSSLQYTPLPLKDKAVTESDVSHTNPQKLRTVKSAESLISSSGGGVSCRNSEVLDSFSPTDSGKVPSWQSSVEYTQLPDITPDYTSPSKSPSYHKHIRSVSHDSYFEHGMDIPLEEQEMEEDNVFQKLSKSSEMLEDADLMEEYHYMDLQELCFGSGTESFVAHTGLQNDIHEADLISPSGSQKIAQKQKLPSPDAEVSTAKVQKLSAKKLYQTLDSPSQEMDNHIISSSDDVCISYKNDEGELHPHSLKKARVVTAVPLSTVNAQQHGMEVALEQSSDITRQLIISDSSLSVSEKNDEPDKVLIHSDLPKQEQKKEALFSDNQGVKELGAIVMSSVPFCDEMPEDGSSLEGEGNRTIVERYGNEETVIVEVHATQESSSDEELEENALLLEKYDESEFQTEKQNSEEATLHDSAKLTDNNREPRETLLSLSMEATLSDTLSLSQLLSFDSPEYSLFSESFAKGQEGADVYCVPPLDSSLATPESPTMDNVSDMPSSAGSEISGESPGEFGEKTDIQEDTVVKNDEKQLAACSEQKIKENESVEQQSLENNDAKLQNVLYVGLKDDSGSLDNSTRINKGTLYISDEEINESEKSSRLKKHEAETIPFQQSFLGNVQKSLENEVSKGVTDAKHLQPTSTISHLQSLPDDDMHNHLLSAKKDSKSDSSEFSGKNFDISPFPISQTKDMTPEKSINVTDDLINFELNTSDDSKKACKTLGIKEKVSTEAAGSSSSSSFLPGLSVKSGLLESDIQDSCSIGSQETSLSSQDSSISPYLMRRRSIVEKLSPISPIEESRRKFESEIGRTIVRDRQMKLEMEQIQAERQLKSLQKCDSLLASKDKQKFHQLDVEGEDRLTTDVELRRSPGRQLESTSVEIGRKRISEPEEVLGYSRSELHDEHKRLSEPSPQVYSRYMRMEKKASVKELLSRFETQPSKEECTASSSEEKIVPEIEESMPVKPKPSHPSLFTQLKVLRLQSLHPSAAQVSPVDVPQRNVLQELPDDYDSEPMSHCQNLKPEFSKSLESSQSLKFDLQSRPSLIPKVEEDSCVHTKKVVADRPQSLDVGRPPKPKTSKSHTTVNDMYSEQHSPTPNGSPPGSTDPQLPLGKGLNSPGAVSVESQSVKKLQSPTLLLRSPGSPPSESKSLESRPSFSDRNGTRRERIDRYKEERRAQLRERFSLEASEKDKAQIKYSSQRGGTGSIPTSPGHDSQTGSISPSKYYRDTETDSCRKGVSSSLSKVTDNSESNVILRTSAKTNMDTDCGETSGLCSQEWQQRWRTSNSNKKSSEVHPGDDVSGKARTSEASETTKSISCSSPERLQRASPTKEKERPKSLPPPVTRSILTDSWPPFAVQGALARPEKEIVIVEIDRNFENVPKYRSPHSHAGSSGKKTEEFSSRGSMVVPKCVRERAAIFERTSDSFGAVQSGQVQGLSLREGNTKPSMSSSHH